MDKTFAGQRIFFPFFPAFLFWPAAFCHQLDRFNHGTGLAIPLPAISKAVPCPTVAAINGVPIINPTRESNATVLMGM